MSETQKEAYEGTTRVKSDPFGLIDRDNRNHRKKQEIILEAVNAVAGDRVLEVGCGAGLHSPEYARRFHYFGIDLSDSLVSETRAKVNAVTDTWGVLQMDAQDLEWSDDEFQAVVGTAILHHMPDPRATLEEWTRVVEPGGSVTLMEPNYLFPKDAIETHLIPEEEHKVNMRPWRLRRIVDGIDDVEWSIQPRIFTPPWPSGLHGLYDGIDAALKHVPLLRWAAQMQLVHVEVRR